METLTRHDAEAFLYREARMMNDGKFDDWLALFTHDAHYWIPSQQGADPQEETAITYYDRATIDDWIFRLRSPAGHAQSPASRTRHVISNVEVEQTATDRATVYSNFILYEVRNGEQRSFAGNNEHHLRRVNGAWRIALKKIWLINRDLPMYNLTFLI